ncbi:MAG: hypothetical protein K2M30_04675 [Desulfovibrionaceae bacterium]|nr:hypothetical protein [Desulfovibrionaceae bacterium]
MKKDQPEEEKVPAWLVTFSDLMTLLLTFFVLLLSMSVIDTKKKLEALGSIRAAFGVITSNKVPEQNEADTTIEHGVFNKDEVHDLISERASERHFSERDIEFVIDRDVAIIRIADDVLFGRGLFSLSQEGKYAVDRLLPLILESNDPVKIIGSTSTLYDEYSIVQTEDNITLWRLSLRRALSIYIYMKQRGIPMQNILLEGISEFHSSFSDKDNATQLLQSRRTDFIFGKRDIARVERLRSQLTSKTTPFRTNINGFEFSLEE